jgi:hypothetical protein
MLRAFLRLLPPEFLALPHPPPSCLLDPVFAFVFAFAFLSVIPGGNLLVAGSGYTISEAA